MVTVDDDGTVEVTEPDTGGGAGLALEVSGPLFYTGVSVVHLVPIILMAVDWYLSAFAVYWRVYPLLLCMGAFYITVHLL